MVVPVDGSQFMYNVKRYRQIMTPVADCELHIERCSSYKICTTNLRTNPTRQNFILKRANKHVDTDDGTSQ
jgi:hypothetical protein